MRIVKALLVLFAVLAVAAGGGLATWVWWQDPDALVEGPLPDYRAVGVIAVAKRVPAGDRRYLQVRLEASDGDVATFVVSLPAERGSARLPVLIVLAGLRSGEATLDRTPWHGPNAIVSYDYPFDPRRWRYGSTRERVELAYNAARRIPNQVAAMTRWALTQDWADRERAAYTGVSLGAVVLPAVLRRAVAVGLRPRPTVIAYGGTDIAAMAYPNYGKIEPAWLRRLAAWGTGLLLYAIEPARHLRHLEGEFLLINSFEDERIPRASVEGLRSLTPAPKEFVTLAGLHIDPKRPEVIARALDPGRDWLIGLGAINP